MKKNQSIHWFTKPISPTCEQKLPPDFKGSCGEKATFAYEAYGGGWMSLCAKHVGAHSDYVKPITALLGRGETLSSQ